MDRHLKPEKIDINPSPALGHVTFLGQDSTGFQKTVSLDKSGLSRVLEDLETKGSASFRDLSLSRNGEEVSLEINWKEPIDNDEFLHDVNDVMPAGTSDVDMHARKNMPISELRQIAEEFKAGANR